MQIYGKLPLAFTKHLFLFHFFLICDFVVVELSCLFGLLVEGVFVVVCDCICICCRWIELVIWLVGRVCARWIQVEGAHLWPRPVPLSTESLPIVIIVITRPKPTYRPARRDPGAKILFKRLAGPFGVFSMSPLAPLALSSDWVSHRGSQLILLRKDV